MKQKPYTSKAWLEMQRYTKRKSIEDIAKESGVSYNTIKANLKKHGIK